MRKKVALAGLVLLPFLLAAVGYGAQRLAEFAFGQSITYPGPSVEGAAPGPPTTPVAQRVVVVVVDALRDDTSRQMPALERLRQAGADLPSYTGMPSLSLPGYTTLGTGAYPDLSGVLTNWYENPVRVDSLFAQARQAGRRTALVTMSSWETLYGPWVDYVWVASWPEEHDLSQVAQTTEDLGREALRVLREEEVSLLYVHLGETDEVGHAFGGTSPEYLEAAQHVDAQVARIADELDWSRDTLILTADHGMTAGRRTYGGGHGGYEEVCRRVPVVMVGRGIAPGTYPEGGQADIVPTIATLLGLPIPAHNQGHTRLDLLVLDPQGRAEAALALAEQQSSLYRAYLRTLGAADQVDGLTEARAALAGGEYDRAVEQAQEFLDRLDRAVERAESNRLWQERLARLPYLLVPLLLGGLALALWRPRGEIVRPALLALLFFALYLALYAGVRGFTWSFSTIGGLDEEAFFLARTTDAIGVLLLVAVVAGLVWWNRPWKEVIWRSEQTVLVVLWALAVQAGLYLWLYGLFIRWRPPHLGWGFKFYLDMLVLVGVGYAGLLFPWLARGVSRVVRFLKGRRRHTA